MRKLLWLLPLAFLFVACQKESSFEAPATTSGTSSGTSVYTLGGAGNSCTGAIVNGTYTSGVALGAINTVTINVTVTTVGTYAISTTAVNGMTFTASGAFTATGLQAITLTGSGTPTAVATSTVSVTVGTTSCSFSVPVVAPGPPATYTIAGAGSSCTGSTVSGTYNAGTALTSSNTATIQVSVTVLGSYNITTTTTNGYSFSGAGTFTTLGTQSVVLTGNGTPTAAGTDGFTAGTSGCTFNVTIDAAVNTGTGKITCTIAGITKTFNNFAYGKLLTSSNLDVMGYTTSSMAEQIDLTAMYTDGSVVGTGSYSFNSSGAKNFGELYYSDNSGGKWSSGFNTSTLSVDPCTINITSITATNVKGTFTGTVRSNGGSGSSTTSITSGTFDVPIQ